MWHNSRDFCEYYTSAAIVFFPIVKKSHQNAGRGKWDHYSHNLNLL